MPWCHPPWGAGRPLAAIEISRLCGLSKRECMTCCSMHVRTVVDDVTDRIVLPVAEWRCCRRRPECTDRVQRYMFIPARYTIIINQIAVSAAIQQ